MKKQREKIRVRTQEDMQRVVDIVMRLPYDGSKEVIVQDYSHNRGLEQNSLYWRWLDELRDQTGYTPDELHDRFKKTYMLRIYLQNPMTKEQEDWVGLYDMIKEDGTKQMIDRALDTISTTMATTQQFKEYMDLIDEFCIQKGFQLPAGKY